MTGLFFKPAEKNGVKDSFQAGKRTGTRLLTACKQWCFAGTLQFEIGLEFLAAVWAGHKHSTDIPGKAQLLSAFPALLNGIFFHKPGRLNHTIFLKGL